MARNESLYQILDVSKSADKDSIKKAYRKKAMTMHPDHGGNVEKFGAIKLAHDILTDDERRKKYDETGDTSEKAPDNAYATAINIVGGAFNVVLTECASAGQSPLETDMVGRVKSTIKKTIDEATKQIRILRNMLDSDKRMRGRFKSKKENIFESILSNRIMSLEINIKNCEDVINNSNAALEMIKDYSFRSDPKSHSSSTMQYFTVNY